MWKLRITHKDKDGGIAKIEMTAERLADFEIPHIEDEELIELHVFKEMEI